MLFGYVWITHDVGESKCSLKCLEIDLLIIINENGTERYLFMAMLPL